MNIIPVNKTIGYGDHDGGGERVYIRLEADLYSFNALLSAEDVREHIQALRTACECLGWELNEPN